MASNVIFVAVLLSGLCTGSHIKQWLPNLNIDNPNNWNVKRLPCTNDIVKVLDQDTAVFMQSNLTIKELVLPMTGEVVLGDDIMLAFSDAPDPTPGCSADGQEVEFVRKDPESWFDPLNWCVTNDTQSLCSSALNKLDLLDTEHIPCQFEMAFFPPSHEYFVDISGNTNISVSKIIFSETTYSATNDFESFLETSSGRRQFTSKQNGTTKGNVIITNKDGCSDITGCMCGNDHGKVEDMICSKVIDRCKVANCTEPFFPVGGCCPLCGAMFVLEYGGGFRMDKLKAFLKSDDIFSEVIGFGDVQTIVSKTFQDKIQIVLTDRVDGKHAIQFGELIDEQLMKDIKGDRQLGLVSLNLNISEPKPPVVMPTAAPQEKKPIQSGTIAGIIVTLILILTIVVVIGCFFYRKRQGLPLIPFINSFSKSTEIELGASVSYDHGVVEIDATMRGFDNPMYDSPISKDHEPTFFQDPSKAIPEIKYTNGNTITAFENPVYSQEGLEEDTDL